MFHVNIRMLAASGERDGIVCSWGRGQTQGILFPPTTLVAMGRVRRSRTHHARRDVHRDARTRVRESTF